jgi:hypothetical protein
VKLADLFNEASLDEAILPTTKNFELVRSGAPREWAMTHVDDADRGLRLKNGALCPANPTDFGGFLQHGSIYIHAKGDNHLPYRISYPNVIFKDYEFENLGEINADASLVTFVECKLKSFEGLKLTNSWGSVLPHLLFKSITLPATGWSVLFKHKKKVKLSFIGSFSSEFLHVGSLPNSAHNEVGQLILHFHNAKTLFEFQSRLLDSNLEDYF